MRVRGADPGCVVRIERALRAVTRDAHAAVRLGVRHLAELGGRGTRLVGGSAGSWRAREDSNPRPSE